MTVRTLLPIMPKASPNEGLHSGTATSYSAQMTSVNSIIAAIEIRRPGLSDVKTQLLLFFCQGHHLAHCGDALFVEPMYAADRGVAVEDVHGEPASPLRGEGPLNTIGGVLERYGDLSPADLRTLVEASLPWQMAIKSSTSPRIEWAWLRDWFRRPDETNDPDDDRLTDAQVAAWVARRRVS